jgi:DNA-binding CsgD family transcriptional regulator
MEVLQHLQAGQSHRDIARAMGISQSTVDRHVADLYVKLHVRSREQAIARAAELAWLLSPEKLYPPESTAGSEHDGHDVCEPSESRR